MSFRSLASRLLLSVALILNGSGYATAGVGMRMPVSAADSAMPDCHRHPVGMAMRQAVAATGAAQGEPVAVKHASPECCKSDPCRCACVYHAVALVPRIALGAPIAERIDELQPMRPGHTTPPLSRHIRPPIG